MHSAAAASEWGGWTAAWRETDARIRTTAGSVDCWRRPHSCATHGRLLMRLLPWQRRRAPGQSSGQNCRPPAAAAAVPSRSLSHNRELSRWYVVRNVTYAISRPSGLAYTNTCTYTVYTATHAGPRRNYFEGLVTQIAQGLLRLACVIL